MKGRGVWLLPAVILLVGCPGPEDRKNLEVIFQYEEYVDNLMRKLSSGQSDGRGFSLSEEGGAESTTWIVTLNDYMIKPLAYPGDSWLGNISLILVRDSEVCAPSHDQFEVSVDIVGAGTQWAPCSVVSRLSPVDGIIPGTTWRLWEHDCADWKYLAQCLADLAEPLPYREGLKNDEDIPVSQEDLR